MKNFNMAGRAQAGGEKGVNGDHYKGGQFLPATQAPKGTFTLTAPTPLDDAAQAERAARKARQEAEVTAFQERCKAVATDPRTLWLAAFLTDAFTQPGYQGLRDDGYWYDETHSWEHHTWMENGVQIRKAQVFTSDFARSMHAELTRYGKFPWELSDRAYGILAEMYAKKGGARRNSKAYNALLDEFETNTLPAEARSACQRPCAECPWRTDVPTGRFPVERYVGLAHTAYDGGMSLFACHKSSEGRDVACAGFLMVGAEHNLRVRLNRMSGHYSDVTDGGHTLYASFREMAEANGVPPDSPVLDRCRDD